VLARTNAQLLAFKDALDSAGVPYWAPSPELEGPEDETTSTKQTGPAERTDSVTLCSFHRAKGLEWGAVWVVGLETGFVPIARAGGRKGLDEERRLLYVALTRASRELHCSWARMRSFGGRPVPRECSPWLELISPSGRENDDGQSPDPESDVDFWRDRLRAQREALAANRLRGGGRRRSARRTGSRWPDPDPEIVAALRSWRSQAARASGVPPYVILHDATLSAVASLRPKDDDELVAVPGLGPVKASRYGSTLLAIVARRRETA
jgi:ATP-dependent DNA helicase UvrD/PcrA